MVLQEKKLLFIALFLFVINFFVSICYPVFMVVLRHRPDPPIVKILENGRRAQEVRLMPSDEYASVLIGSFVQFFTLYVPAIFLARYLFPFSLGNISTQITQLFSEHFVPQGVLWLLAIVSILLVFIYGSRIFILKKVFYAYIIAVQLAGLGAMLWSTF